MGGARGDAEGRGGGASERGAGPQGIRRREAEGLRWKLRGRGGEGRAGRLGQQRCLNCFRCAPAGCFV